MDETELRAGEVLLEVRGISKHYGGIRALDDVSMTIGANEIVGLVGANGAGKSTLVHILSGIVKPDKGEVLVAGSPVVINGPLESRHLGIEVVYQNLALIDTLDAASNVHLGREICRPKILDWLDDAAMQSSAHELLMGLGLNLNLKQIVRSLSGGQRQGVALARAVFFKARIAIFDEPTAALGVAETKATLRTILDFRSRGVGVLVVSHDLEDVFRITDRIIVMRVGRVVAERATKSTTQDEVLELITTAE